MNNRYANLSWTDVRSGLLLVAVLSVASAIVFFMDEIRRGILEGPQLVLRARVAPGLGPGSPVWLAGRQVGRVVSVTFLPPRGLETGGNVAIDAILLRTAPANLRADATAHIRPGDLLEPVVVAIDPGTGSAPRFDLADTLLAVDRDVAEVLLLSLSDSLLSESGRVRPVFDRFAETMRTGRGTIPRLHRDPGLTERLGRQYEAVQPILASGGGAFARFGSDTVLFATLERIRSRLTELQRRREEMKATGAPTHADVAAAFTIARDRAAAIDSALDEAQGTLGRALGDDAIHQEVLLLRARLDSVIAELVADPGRWLRFRLF